MGPYRLGAVQTIAVGAASVAVTNAFGTGTHVVRIASTTACHIVFGGTPVATSSDTLIAASVEGEYFVVSPGEKVAAIQNAAGGTLRVTEVSK